MTNNDPKKQVSSELENLRFELGQLKQRQEEDEILFALPLDMIGVINCDGFFQRLNPAWSKTLGYSNGEFQCYLDLVCSEDRDTTHKLVTNAKDQVVSFENRCVAKDGSFIHCLWNVLRSSDGQKIYLAVRDITELKKHEIEYEKFGLIDQLTGLYNRKGFITHTNSYLKFALRKKMQLLLFLIEMEGLNKIGNTYGRKEREWTLIKAAEIIRATFRDSDIIARIKDDKIAVLALEAWKGSADILQKRLTKSVDLYKEDDSPFYDLSFKFGVAHFDPDEASSIEALLDQAQKDLQQK